jgi:hypothetical protein
VRLTLGSRTSPPLIMPDQLPVLAEQDLYACGDFGWVDISDRRVANNLKPRDLATLLYLARTFQAPGSAFPRSLGNRFVYLAHDDGWSLKLYARRAGDVAALLDAVARAKAAALRCPPLPPRPLGPALLREARAGVLLDFRRPAEGPRVVRCHRPGPFTDMDALLGRVAAGKIGKPVDRFTGR